MIINKQSIDYFVILNGSFRLRLDSNRSITINKKIGRGAEAYVYEVSKINDESHTKWVAKIIDRDEKFRLNKFQKKILNINHENLEKLLFIFKNEQSYLLICEKLDFILSTFKMLDLKNTIYVASEIIEALIFLHKTCLIAHCDLKSNNIMYSKETKRFKLIDFNYCQHQNDFKKIKLKVTLLMTSQSLLKDEYDWGFDVDIWALGSTLYKCYYGHEFLEEFNGYEYIKNHYSLTEIEKKNIIDFYDFKTKDLKTSKISTFFYFFYSSTDIYDLKSKILNYVDKSLNNID